MARNFTGTDVINCGSGSTLDNFLSGTFMAWARYPTADVNARIVSKGTSGTTSRIARLSTTGTGSFDVVVGRATTVLRAEALLSDFTAAAINKWVFFAGVFDTAGANGDQKLYIGDLATVCAEPAAYSTQAVGSGAVGDDSADDFLIGNSSAGTQPWGGDIGLVCAVRRVLTLAEIRSWQWGMRWVLNIGGLWIPGHDNGTSVPDYSGNLNTGTITGTTLAPFLPHLSSAYLGFSDADEERSELVLGAGASGMWPDRRRRARAAIYAMRNRRFRF